ncbi:RIP metalloprotease RseP [Patescibacteria group bacterium]|nr:RIP metalloprotease RseP [Patescibacteria group bacterium]
MDILLVILGLGFLILGHEFGHFSVAKSMKMKVEEFGIGFPPRIFGRKKGDTVYSVNALPFGGFVKLYGEEDEKAGDSEAFLNKPFYQKSLVVLAGIFTNFVIGWILLTVVLVSGTPTHLMIASVEKGSPAETAGLKEGDIIKKVNIGETSMSDPINDTAFVNLVKNSSDASVSLLIMRGKKSMDINLEKRLNPPPGKGAIGISLVDIGAPPEPFFKSIADAFLETVNFSLLIFGGLWSLISGIFVNPSVIEGVAGPVGIVALAANATSIGIVYLLQLLALISVNLAVLNLLPFPALDGGRFLFFLIEKIRGRKISSKIQLAINGAGFFILIILMVFVTFNDVRNLVIH